MSWESPYASRRLRPLRSGKRRDLREERKAKNRAAGKPSLVPLIARRGLAILAILTLLVTRPALAATPSSDYPYRISPTAALKLLAALNDFSAKQTSVSADEARLFADVQSGQLHKLSFGEAALIASGATDPEKRKALVTETRRFGSRSPPGAGRRQDHARQGGATAQVHSRRPDG